MAKNYYFLFFVAIHLISIGVSLVKHGEPKDGNHNFFLECFGSIIGIFLLYKIAQTGL